MAELSETIALRKDKAKGLEAALEILRTDKGKNTMDEIRKVIDRMKSRRNRASEEALGRSRGQRSKRNADHHRGHAGGPRRHGPGRISADAQHCQPA